MIRIFLLPHLPHVCLFTPRLVVHSETFSPVGVRVRQTGKARPSISIIWQEGTAGRDAADVTSAFLRFLETERDAETVTFWTDNCSSQNKNWVLISGVLQAVHRSDLKLQKVTMKYLQKGHTSVSAGTVHPVCNKGLKRTKNVLDMTDFKSAISRSSEVIEMKPEDFRDVVNSISAQKLKLLSETEERPYLAQLRVIERLPPDKKFILPSGAAQEEDPAQRHQQGKAGVHQATTTPSRGATQAYPLVGSAGIGGAGAEWLTQAQQQHAPKQ